METSIKHYLGVSPTISSSGQPTAEQFQQIAEQGFRAVINLAMPDSTAALADEGHIVTSLGMNYIHIPVPFDRPDKTHLKQFFTAMTGFSAEKVWVHCALNYRASAFLYLYLRIVEQQSEQAAQCALFPGWDPNDIWADFIKQSEAVFYRKNL